MSLVIGVLRRLRNYFFLSFFLFNLWQLFWCISIEFFLLFNVLLGFLWCNCGNNVEHDNYTKFWCNKIAKSEQEILHRTPNFNTPVKSLYTNRGGTFAPSKKYLLHLHFFIFCNRFSIQKISNPKHIANDVGVMHTSEICNYS